MLSKAIVAERLDDVEIFRLRGAGCTVVGLRTGVITVVDENAAKSDGVLDAAGVPGAGAAEFITTNAAVTYERTTGRIVTAGLNVNFDTGFGCIDAHRIDVVTKFEEEVSVVHSSRSGSSSVVVGRTHSDVYSTG